MIKKGILGLIVVAFGFFVLSVLILPISKQVNALRTDSQQDTGLGCTTGAAATTCTVVLSNKSAYQPTNPNWTVEETSPSSVTRTANSTLGTNLLDVTISGLSPSTSYIFTIDYFKVDSAVAYSTNLDSVLKRFNFLVVFGALIVLVVGVGLSFNLRNNFS